MFPPGTIISEFTSKKGKQIVFRLVCEDDLEQMHSYVNHLSREDTFVSFSGEQLTLEEEKKYLDEKLGHLSRGDGFLLAATYQDNIVGLADISRMKRRSKHVGYLAISLSSEYREEGIGSELIQTLCELGKKIGFQMVELAVYSVNERGIHVYEKVGFVEVGRIPKKALFHGELVDEIIMVKFL